MNCMIHCCDDSKTISKPIIAASARKLTTLILCSREYKQISCQKEPYKSISNFILTTCGVSANVCEDDNDSSTATCGTTLYLHEDCYKKFTNKNTVKHAVSNRPPTPNESLHETSFQPCLQSSPKKLCLRSEAKVKQQGQVLAKLCIICGGGGNSKRCSRGGKRVYDQLTSAQTMQGGRLLSVAREKNDESIFKHIRGSDCVAKKVMYHRSCYQSYVQLRFNTGAATSHTVTPFEQFINDIIRPQIIDDHQILKYSDIYKLYAEYMQSKFPDEPVHWSGTLKHKLELTVPELGWKVHPNRSESQYVYSKEMELPSVISSTNVTTFNTTHDDSESDCSNSFSNPQCHYSSIDASRELFHVGILVNDSVKQCKQTPDNWPPDMTEFDAAACKKYVPPELFNLMALITGMLHEPPPSGSYADLSHSDFLKVMSVCQDVVFLAGQGKTLTPKSLALGLTMRHYTGNKSVQNLLAKFGNAASYHTILRLETALAVQQNFLSEEYLPPGLSKHKWTTMVWDNIDFTEETISGAGTTHFVNGIVVQKGDSNLPEPMPSFSVPKHINKLPSEPVIVPAVPSYKRGGPSQMFDSVSPDKFKSVDNDSDVLYIMLKCMSSPDTVPDWTHFNQWLLRTYDPNTCAELVKSVIRYLPIIEAPASEMSTIYTILIRSIQIADQLSLDKIALVFDQAIYSKVQELRWQDPEMRRRTIVRMGEFHTAMAFLGIIGKRYGSAGLTDIFIESEIVASGSINGVISGHHYNRAIRSHKVLFEALYSMALESFLSCSESEDAYTSYLHSLSRHFTESKFSDFYELWVSGVGTELRESFHKYLQVESEDNHTFHFWTQYLDMVNLLLAFIRATRTGDWKLHLAVIKQMIPWFFAYDRTHYKRFLPVYFLEMASLSAEEENEMAQSFTVNQTTTPFAATSMDQTIEQTINKQCKTSGGIQGVTLNPGSIRRWILAQPSKAAISAKCEAMAGLHIQESSTSTTATCKTDKLVKSALSTLAGMINPFTQEASVGLVSISSGRVADEGLVDDLLNAYDKGKVESDKFIKERLIEKTVDLFTTVPMLKLKSFGSTASKKSNQRTTTISHDRSLFSRLLVIGQVRSLDMKKILTYSLHPEPLSLSKDGVPNKTNKAVLLHCIEQLVDERELGAVSNGTKTAVMVDAMALIQSLSKRELPQSFQGLSDVLLNKVLNYAVHYKATRVDFVCDRYIDCSIKNVERGRRGASGFQRISILSETQKLPKQWSKFLACSENKTELINFLFKQWSTKTITGMQLYITDETECCRVTDNCVSVPELHSSHEEADTRLLFHTSHAAEECDLVILVTPDTDVAVIGLNICSQVSCTLAMSCGKGRTRRVINLSRIAEQLPDSFIHALPFIHALTGCDSVSSFCGKGKKKALKILKQRTDVQQVLSVVGEEPLITPEQYATVQRFICELYGKDCEYVNEARYKLFSAGVTEHNLPPNEDCLLQHSRRACYQAHVWRSCLNNNSTLVSPVGFGWTINKGHLEIVWRVSDMAPKELLSTVYCNCKKTMCSSGKCSCYTNKLKCTDACNCDLEKCANQPDEDHHRQAISDSESDDDSQ